MAVTSQDIMYAKVLKAYGQGAKPGKFGVVVNVNEHIDPGNLLALGDLEWEEVADFAAVVRVVGIYDPKLENPEKKKIYVLDDYAQVGDLVSYEICGDNYVIKQNYTRETKDNLIKQFDNACRTVFGNHTGNGK